MIPTIDRIGLEPRPVAPDAASAVAGRPTGTAPSPPGGAAPFAEALASAAQERSVQLSGHALRRLEQRHIDLQSDQLDRLQRAMETLSQRGSRQSLVMLDQVAYVVHVPSHTVLTAVEPEGGKENVFTRIDSVVIA
ncbi:MAG TPA: hypothetical protein VF763_02845 [Candidatus Limnocylindrales bacterium]